MTNDQLNEAKRLIANKVSKRAAAKAVGVSESTLRNALKRGSEPELQPQSESESESESEPNLTPGYDWAPIAKLLDEIERRRIEKLAQEGNTYAIRYLQSQPAND